MSYILWRKKLSVGGLLYVILDKEIIERNKIDIFSLAEKLSLCKIDIFQFRFKDNFDRENLVIAQRLSRIVHRRKKMFIVNDRVDIACLSGADGVHLGAEDLEVKEARKLLGKKKIIGKTVHSKEEFRRFLSQKVDYLSIGPLFKTPTKPFLPPWNINLLKGLIKEVRKVLFAIGGIDLTNLSEVVNIGINNVAVCRGIILSNNFKDTVERFKLCLKKAC